MKHNYLSKLCSVLLIVLLLLLVFAGCGGSGNTGSEGDDAWREDLAWDDEEDTADNEDEVEDDTEEEPVGPVNVEDLLQFQEPRADQPIATIHTNMGDIRIMLFPEQAPKAVENFVVHSLDGYYDGVIFHRVIEEFMIQGGDPTGTGMGGESIYTDTSGAPISFEDEFSEELFNFRGALSMANAGANTNGSQFFIVQNTGLPYTYDDYANGGWPLAAAAKYEEIGGAYHLDYAHTVFGQVIDGMDVVDAIVAVETDENDKPLEDVVIQSVTIENWDE